MAAQRPRTAGQDRYVRLVRCRCCRARFCSFSISVGRLGSSTCCARSDHELSDVGRHLGIDDVRGHLDADDWLFNSWMIDRHAAGNVPCQVRRAVDKVTGRPRCDCQDSSSPGYTGVLLAATAVPLWSKRPALLGPLFLSSAMTSGAAAISAVALAMEREERRRLRPTPHTGDAVDGCRGITPGDVDHRARSHGQANHRGPSRRSRAPRRRRRGHGATARDFGAFTIFRGGMRRPATLVSAVLTLAGVFAVRYAVVMGGRQSADDPRATFDMTG